MTRTYRIRKGARLLHTTAWIAVRSTALRVLGCSLRSVRRGDLTGVLITGVPFPAKTDSGH
jgi:hypothetical protein